MVGWVDSLHEMVDFLGSIQSSAELSLTTENSDKQKKHRS